MWVSGMSSLVFSHSLNFFSDRKQSGSETINALCKYTDGKKPTTCTTRSGRKDKKRYVCRDAANVSFLFSLHSKSGTGFGSAFFRYQTIFSAIFMSSSTVNPRPYILTIKLLFPK